MIDSFNYNKDSKDFIEGLELKYTFNKSADLDINYEWDV